MRTTRGLCLIVSLMLAACSVHSVQTRPEPGVALPEAYTEEVAGPPVPDRWWTIYGDEELNALVGRVLEQNLDLRQAWARLDQAAAIARQAGSARWPQLGVDVSVSRSRSVFTTGPLSGISSTNDTFRLAGAASYEVDLWGRVSHQVRAAELDVVAGRLDLEALAMTLAAQVVDLWFRLGEARAQLALLDEQTAVNRTYLDLVRGRFERGMATAVEVLQQEQQLAATEGQRPVVEAGIRVLENQLAVLLGEAPGASAQSVAGLPEPPPVPAAGIPSDLLTRRPDIEAARLRVLAADHRVGVAIADRFPTLRLSAEAGFQSSSITEIFQGWLWNLVAGISASVFDGGRKSAEVERTEAVLRERAAAYAQTVVAAMNEVASALAQAARHAEFVASLDAQAKLAQTSLETARTRYLYGLSDYLNVLLALQATQQVERNLLQAQRDALGYQMTLARAVGGSWTAELRGPSCSPGDDGASSCGRPPGEPEGELAHDEADDSAVDEKRDDTDPAPEGAPDTEEGDG